MKTRRVARSAIILILLAFLAAQCAPSTGAAEVAQQYLVSVIPGNNGDPISAVESIGGTIISSRKESAVASLTPSQVSQLHSSGLLVGPNREFDTSAWDDFRAAKALQEAPPPENPVPSEPLPPEDPNVPPVDPSLPPDIPVIDPPVPNPTPEVIPPGVSRVGGPFVMDEAFSVAIVDSGITPQPDLNVLPGTSCTTDEDPFGYTDEVGHGTHVAGIYGAIQNGFGVAGVVPGIPVIPVRIGSYMSPPTDDSIACGLRHILKNHRDTVPPTKLVNLSLGRMVEPYELSDDGKCGLLNGDILHTLVCALQDEGVAVVVSAGNSTTDSSLFIPAGYPEVMTVSAMTDTDGIPGGLGEDPYPSMFPGMPKYFADDTFAFFSNFKGTTDIAAPGVKVLSTQPDMVPLEFDGTSMSAPHAGGVVIYIYSQWPDATVDEIFELIMLNAEVDPLPYSLPGFEPSQYDKLHQEPLIQGFTLEPQV